LWDRQLGKLGGPAYSWTFEDREVKTSRSIIGGEFLAEAIGKANVGTYDAILPRITAQAWIYSQESLRVSEDDPFRNGFALSDTWGQQVEQLTSVTSK